MMEYKQDHIRMSFKRQAFKFPENMILNVKANFDQWNYNGNFDTWIEVSNAFWCCFGCYDIRGGFNSFHIENKIVKFGLTLNHHCARISIKYVKGTITIYHKYNDLFTTILVTITKYFSVNNLTNNDDKQHRWYKHNRRSMIYYSYWVFLFSRHFCGSWRH